ARPPRHPRLPSSLEQSPLRSGRRQRLAEDEYVLVGEEQEIVLDALLVPEAGHLHVVLSFDDRVLEHEAALEEAAHDLEAEGDDVLVAPRVADQDRAELPGF